MNASHEVWGSTTTSNHGTRLHDAIEDADLLLLNTGEPTFQSYQHRTFSHLDLSYCTADIFPTTSWRAYTYGSSDHLPILICNSRPIQIWNANRNYWRFKNANWDLFLQLQEQVDFDDDEEDLEQITNHFTEALIAAGEMSIGLGIRKPHQRSGPPWWNSDCRKALAKKRKARHLAKSRSYHDYVTFKRCCAESRRVILAAKRLAWQHYCTSLAHTETLTSVWRRAKGLSSTYIQNFPTLTDANGKQAITDLEKAKALLEPYSHEAPYDRVSRALDASFRGIDHTAPQDYNNPITKFEVIEALQSAKMGAMGPDNIPYQFLKNLAPTFLDRLLFIFNLCFLSGSIPSIWKTSTLLPIIKPGKPKDLPSSYRPIALASCTLKILEKIIAKRLTFYLESNNLMSDSQFGFRQAMGCEEALDSITTDIRTAMSKGQYTICAFMDIRKAFDLVRHEAILAALRKASVSGRLFLFCQEYLKDRALQITIGNSTASQTLSTGVPQGGPLSAHLFATVMGQIPPINVEHTKTGLYADDTNLRVSHKSVTVAAERINEGLISLHENAEFWGLQFDPAKSCVIIFAQSHKRRNFSQIQIKFGDIPIPIVESHRFLGLVFDRSLKWTSHIDSLVARCGPYLNLLRSVAAKNWGSDQASLRTLYITLIRSKITYGLAQYGACTKKDFEKLERLQNKALRTILGLPRSTPIAAMQILANIPSLKLQYEQITMIQAVKQIARNDVSPLKLLLNNAIEKWPGKKPAATTGLQFLINNGISHLIHYTEPLPRISALPPWKQNTISVEDQWLTGNKADYNAAVLKVQAMNKISNLPPDAINIYTDGSLIPETMQNGIGIYCQRPEKEIRIKLHEGASICTTELYAIGYAIDWALENNYTCLNILSDSKSALAAIANSNLNYQVIRNIAALPDHIQIKFLWIPSHVDIWGNENADKLATRACVDPHLQPAGAIPFADGKHLIKHNVLKKWKATWEDGLTGRQTQEIFPAPRKITQNSNTSRTMQTAVNALATNRASLNQFLHLIRRSNSPNCQTCNVLDNTEHYLLKCKVYDVQRTIFKNTLQKYDCILNVKNILGGADVPALTLNNIQGALKTYISSTIGFKRLLGY